MQCTPTCWALVGSNLKCLKRLKKGSAVYNQVALPSPAAAAASRCGTPGVPALTAYQLRLQAHHLFQYTHHCSTIAVSMQASTLCNSTSTTATTAARWQPQVPTPRRCACASKRSGADGPVISQDFEVPQVGWMWDPSSAKSHTTARTLKAAKIKAKK